MVRFAGTHAQDLGCRNLSPCWKCRVLFVSEELAKMATATAPPLNASSPPWTAYDTEGFYDEMFDEQGQARPRAELLLGRLRTLADGELILRQRAADLALLNMGITFNVYGHEAGTEKIWPFDIIPRIIEAREWRGIEAGLKQRITALNLFIDDLYHDQKIVRDGVFPEYMVQSSKCFLKRCVGLNPPRRIWCHITGTDLVRDRDGTVYVLEDNLRCPSGVSYVLENREVMKRTFPQVFDGLSVLPVEDYPEHLRKMLEYIAPPTSRDPTVVVLTPGSYNSAYFEHCFLAQQMGVEVVQGSDLVVSDGYVHARTTRGLKRVDVIYRRIDDDFLDPLTFRPDSMLGVPGLMDVYRRAGWRWPMRPARASPTTRRSTRTSRRSSSTTWARTSNCRTCPPLSAPTTNSGSTCWPISTSW